MDNNLINRLRVTRELTDKEYKNLLKYEEKNGELTPSEIAKRYNFDITG